MDTVLGQHHTRWVVLAGGPSSGKTSLVTRFAACGIAVNPEAARGYIVEQVRKGLSKEQVRTPFPAFQTTIYRRQSAAERALPHSQPVILDGALPDSLAYCRANGHKPWEELQNDLHLHRYIAVFLLEPLPFFEKDNVRTENLPFSRTIFQYLQEIYRDLGYKPVTVPAFLGTAEASIRQRLVFIAEHLHACGIPLPFSFLSVVEPKLAASPATMRMP